MRAGYGRSLFQPLLPIILGRDVSVEVADVGSSVKSLHVGQEVFGALHPTAVRGTMQTMLFFLKSPKVWIARVVLPISSQLPLYIAHLDDQYPSLSVQLYCMGIYDMKRPST
ncbi:hypothetical protein ACET3Z_023113 [Daucus carota]